MARLTSMQGFYQAFAQSLRARGPAPLPRDRCGTCRHFRNDSTYLEIAIPGLSSLSSGSASVRADDGLCLRHDRYLGAGRSCADFVSVG
jgi:hypothetical protein